MSHCWHYAYLMLVQQYIFLINTHITLSHFYTPNWEWVLVTTVLFWSIQSGVCSVTSWTKFHHRPVSMWPGTSQKSWPMSELAKGHHMPVLPWPSVLDDSDVPLKVLTWELTAQRAVTQTMGYIISEGGAIVSNSLAEQFEEEDIWANIDGGNKELGHGKCLKQANHLYSVKTFWMHGDDNSDEEMI